MYGFIFGFQRLVWCPKCTPASRSSGTNSVVFAIRENELFGTPNSERGRCYRGGAKANRMFRLKQALDTSASTARSGRNVARAQHDARHNGLGASKSLISGSGSGEFRGLM